ncbi:hypothetical protein [Haloferula sp. BvORR071]|uniref:hypothetical protein n=1 Tax=Haloferula sp. BvORR071 TaxID=1396141 RepID=UPI0005538941|nr:hypothetical protein [Haloferula sp. BvORR071]
MTGDLSEQQQKEVSGPQATDDLTIAENLRTWRQKHSGEGEVVYSDGVRPQFKIRQHKAEKFIEAFGPLHPDYKDQFNRDWREDFAKLAD